MTSPVFSQDIQGHEHWTYRCPPAPDGCGYQTFLYTTSREASEEQYADHRRTHRIPPTHPTTQGASA